MKNSIWILALALASVLGIGGQPPQAPADKDLSWAFPSEVERNPPIEEAPGPKRLPGSTKSYTQEQIDDLSHPPDWYPDEHGPAPAMVRNGTQNGGFACGSCHLMSGHGHPESADLTGLTADYIVQQMSDFQRGARKDSFGMNRIARTTSTEDLFDAAEWFASLKTGRWVKVIEKDTVPKTYVGPGRMRLAEPGGGTEPIGNRMIELPEDAGRARRRDPHSGFIAYVPPGSIAKGETLAKTGGSGKTLRCEICHGEGLKGSAQAPRLAGVQPIYLARQLYNFQTGAAGGDSAESMKPVVANLSDDNIIALAAYAAAQAP